MNINRNRPPKDKDNLDLWLSECFGDMLRDALEADMSRHEIDDIVMRHLRAVAPRYSPNMSARSAARAAMPLSGSESQALEHALTQAEKEGQMKWTCTKCGHKPNHEKNPHCQQCGSPRVPEHKPGKYEVLGQEIGRLVDEKNKAYGDSFNQCGEFLKLLWPDGVPQDRYQDMLALVRIFDKMKRIATQKDAFGESPFKDIAGYGLLGAMAHKEEE